jgi:hypothetical protein
MVRLCTLLIGITALFLLALSGVAQETAQQKFPIEQQKPGVTVRLTKVRWAKPEDVHYVPFWKDPAQRVLEVQYEIERPEAAEKNVARMRVRWFTTGAVAASTGEYSLMGRLTRGHLIFTQADPRASRLDLEVEVPRPNAPPAANGITEEVLDFGTLPVPALGDAILEIHQQRKTTLGTTVEIESARWQKFQRKTETTNAQGGKESQTFDGRQLLFTTRVVPPSTPVAKASVRLEHGFVTDATGQSVNPPQFYYGSNTVIARDRTERTELFVTEVIEPRESNLKDVHLKIKVREDAPSRRLPEWSPMFRFTLDPSVLPSAIASSEPPPPLAQSEFPGGVVELESMHAPNIGIPGRWKIRVRTRSLFRAGENTPPWIWTPEIQKVRDDTGHEWTYALNTEPVRFHADGAPLRPSEYAADIAYQGGSTPDAKTLDLKLRLNAHRIVGPLQFENVPVPRTPGEVLPLRKVQTDASGAKLILWKVGAFDKTHPTALTAPGRNQSSQAGVALVFEYRPIPDGAKIDRFTLGPPIARDESGAILPVGVHFGDEPNAGKYATANGDLLKAGIEEGEWFSVFLPTPPLETKTLDVAMQVYERQAPDAGPAVEWKAIPLPDAHR